MDIIASGISKKYFRDQGTANYFEAVKCLDLELKEGSLTVLSGRSGSGKTTLLSIFAGLLTPSEGCVYATDDTANIKTDIYSLDDNELSKFRNENIAVIPQGQTAIASLDVTENILLPTTLYRETSEDETSLAFSLMNRLGIAHLAEASPRELSGGELRRMAIARALVMHPKVLLADEPTGDLDDESTRMVLEMLRDVARAGTSVMVVTHEQEAEKYADVFLTMDAGMIK